MKTISFLIFILTCSFSSLHAYIIPGLFIEAYNEPGTYQATKSGKTDSMTMQTGVGAVFIIPIQNRYYFTPSVGLVFHRATDDDYGKQSRRTYYIKYNFGYSLLPSFVLHAGLSSWMNQIKGEGGSVTVNNGSGVDTAYRPKESSWSFLTGVDAGAEWLATNQFSLEGTVTGVMLLDSKRRGFGYSIRTNLFF